MTSLQRCDTLSLHKREKLLLQLRERGVLHTDAISKALLSVPREVFVPVFYHTDASTYSRRTPWIRIDHRHTDYLEKVYEDQPLVIHLDPHGIPDSSSSMPTVMVHMLEALDVRPTHTVLEIGTGTGYNAALLGTLAQQVTSIDIEETFITQAKQHLSEMHLKNVSVSPHNGILGYPAQSPYDRILVTASAPTIPMAWIEQLAPNGKIVCDFDGGFEHAFLVIEKDGAGTISGFIRPERLHFMPMYGAMLPEYRRMHVPTLPIRSDFRLSEGRNTFLKDLQATRSFRWFLQLAKPGITMQEIMSANQHMIRIIAPDAQRYVTFLKENETTSWQEEEHANTHGGQTLRDLLFALHAYWKKLKEPPVEDYLFCCSHDRPALRYATTIFPLLSLSIGEKFSHQQP